MNVQVNPDELISAQDTAAELRQKPLTLACWRHQGKGPAYVKIGRQIFYRRADLSTWLGAQRREPQAKASENAA